MKRQGTREQRNQGTEGIGRLLREAVPPVGARGEMSDDLWPAMQRRLRAEESQPAAKIHVPWFDWALAAGLAASLALFPAWIPVLLYYL